jgi:hypothetical protein
LSLRDIVASGIETAFAIAAEYVVVGTYKPSDGTPVYDPDTDTMTQGTPIPDVRFMPVNNQVEEREASPVAVTDLKLLVPGKDLKGVVPSDTGKCQLWDKWHNVILARAVPGQDLWIIFVRQA